MLTYLCWLSRFEPDSSLPARLPGITRYTLAMARMIVMMSAYRAARAPFFAATRIEHLITDTICRGRSGRPWGRPAGNRPRSCNLELSAPR
jgi:hypothetical protein